MKGFIAFIAHCPELRENQRVVVVGECPELGGWELGGALSLAPAPCGRPWWVSSEVEVNLPESTMGVSGDFVNGVGAGGEDGWVGVSELKFRLLAIPNDGKEVQVSHPGNLVCLEPLRGGDFRIVRLVGAPPLSDCSSVGRRGVNTVCVGAEGGGEHQKRELVGISVEWGVSESVQLALLDLPANHQTDQSEIASPPSTEGGGQRESGRFDARSHHTVCRPQSAVEPKRSDGERGRGSGSKNMTERVWQRAADAQSDDPTSPPDPSNSTHLQMRDRTRDVQPRQGQSEKTDEPAVSMKRRRSESYLAQVDSLVEADACDEVSGCSGERRGGGLRGEVRGRGCVREEKQLRLTVSLSDSARLSSEMCTGRGDPMAGGRVVVSKNDCRRGGGGEVKRNRNGQILCFHGRVRTACKECGGGSICEHGSIRSQCKQCGGNSVCEHGRPRHQCKDCGGKGICEHGRIRSQCKDCGGKSVCEHGRIRSSCKECGGKSVCEHGRQRYVCKDCGGGGICEHGRMRSRCKECGGKSLCEHGRQRCFCKDCGGGAFCVHRRQRRRCQDCTRVSSLPP